MNRALVLTALSFSFLLAAPLLNGCSSSNDEATDTSSSDDLKKSCKGALPDICEKCDDGSSACAHWVKTDGKCEVQICAPSTEACTGALPRLCKTCDDGSTACAHWEKDAGKCTIAYCAASTENECNKDSDCKGALPTSCEVCADGTGACAHHVCTDNKCEISYCSAAQNTPPDPNACKKDSDCKGPLPSLCKLCSDGTDGCAHHTCNSGECSISYCD